MLVTVYGNYVKLYCNSGKLVSCSNLFFLEEEDEKSIKSVLQQNNSAASQGQQVNNVSH